MDLCVGTDLEPGHTSGPVGHTEGKSSWWEDRAAQEGITELRAAQMSAKSVRKGKPSRAPQLTPTPFAITSPSSTVRPGEKC
jgi:hypothetical protein